MDHILYWNGVALEANRRDFTDVSSTQRPEQGGPTLSSRALAIVHLAMYDAHAGAVRSPDLPRYSAAVAAPATATNAAAAVAGAAHECLSQLYPRQKTIFDDMLRMAAPGGAGAEDSLAFGRLVGKAQMQDRALDDRAGQGEYSFGTARGDHRSDPTAAGVQEVHGAQYGSRTKTFAVTDRAPLHLEAYPALDSAEYLRALRQVRRKGIKPELVGTVPAAGRRTPDETLVGIYWAYDGVKQLGTPPRLYNLIVREVAQRQNNSADDNARLFALVNAAMGDAGVLAWEEKYRHNLWRPVVGVREHDPSMGPQGMPPSDDLVGDCDPGWLPLGAPGSNGTSRNFTPPFPAYPSGHATFGAAAFHMVRMFYGVAPNNTSADTLFNGAYFVSEECDGITRDADGVVRPRHEREFDDGLWQMIVENGLSRVYLGVHWSFDAFALGADGKPDLTKNIGGVPLGLKIARNIFAAGGGKAPKRSLV